MAGSWRTHARRGHARADGPRRPAHQPLAATSASSRSWSTAPPPPSPPGTSCSRARMSDDPHRHGTFDDVIAKLPYVRDMGFDVLYFPPIHPIGRTNRKGRNNSLTPAPDDPGSPYAIGAAEGGHDALHPELGTLRGFRAAGRGRRTSTASRSRSTSPSSARRTIPGSSSIRNGSTGGRTARSSTPRIRPRSTRTSSTSTSIGGALPAIWWRCATSSCSGSTRA